MEARWARSALKELQGILDRKQQKRIADAIAEFANDPFGEHPNATALQNEKNLVRVRVGDYRVIIFRESNLVEVRAIRHRQEAYKR